MESDEEINLIIEEDKENDYYFVQIINDTKNKTNNFLNVKLEFSDHLCIYNLDNKLLYEISYYNILSWLHNEKLWGIKYKNYDNIKDQIIFKVDNSNNILDSIKYRVNELLDYYGKIEII
tara:strand:- start:3134 stop:3493 length:360 start_codon:yes stop_codon:yes gene_type:complete